VGEKGNLATSDPMHALDALPLDVLKGSPETMNAWFDTYLKFRTVRDMGRVADAAEESATAAQASARAAEDETPGT
jgi:hypothetical protein